MADPAELENRFTYHPPSGAQPAQYTAIRSMALVFAQKINQIVPESREKSLALTNLEQTVMWANAAIARNPPDRGGDESGNGS